MVPLTTSGAMLIYRDKIKASMKYVLYHATWCPFCRAFAPKFRKMLPDGEEVLLDDERDPRWIELNIEFVPTIIAFEGDSGDITFLGRVYRGYNISAVGSVIGLVWAFIDGLIGGAIFAWLYNCLVDKITPAKSE